MPQPHCTVSGTDEGRAVLNGETQRSFWALICMAWGGGPPVAEPLSRGSLRTRPGSEIGPKKAEEQSPHVFSLQMISAIILSDVCWGTPAPASLPHGPVWGSHHGPLQVRIRDPIFCPPPSLVVFFDPCIPPTGQSLRSYSQIASLVDKGQALIDKADPHRVAASGRVLFLPRCRRRMLRWWRATLKQVPKSRGRPNRFVKSRVKRNWAAHQRRVPQPGGAEGKQTAGAEGTPNQQQQQQQPLPPTLAPPALDDAELARRLSLGLRLRA